MATRIINIIKMHLWRWMLNKCAAKLSCTCIYYLCIHAITYFEAKGIYYEIITSGYIGKAMKFNSVYMEKQSKPKTPEYIYDAVAYNLGFISLKIKCTFLLKVKEKFP
jgi:hypothetical protein